jgi:hypothetical protein
MAVLLLPLLLFSTGLAEGATLLTPPLDAGVDGQLWCMIANVGARDRQVTFTWTAPDGSEGTLTRGVPAGTHVGVLTGAPGGVCRFSAPGAKNLYRAAACIREGGPTCTGAVEAR